MMTWATHVAIYIIIWWLTLFAVLPWGVRPPDQPGEGHVPSAPERPRLGLKALVTTVISVVIYAILLDLVEVGIINFDYDQ